MRCGEVPTLSIIWLMTARAVQPSTHLPVTQLDDDELLFRDTVRKFARQQIAPHVREMDESGAFRKDLLQQFFELGLMGIEIPEEYGGSGATFFHCILAIEELSAVD